MERHHDKCTSDIAALERRKQDLELKNRRRQQRIERDKLLFAATSEECGRIDQLIQYARSRRDRARVLGQGRLTLKNADVVRVWGAIQDAFAGPFAREGIASNQLYKAMRTAIPGIPDSTMRSHLHRLKKRRFLSHIGSRWFLDRPMLAKANCDASPPETPGNDQRELR
jgi:hypothetical protein